MQLGAALKRVGGEIVKEKVEGTSATYQLRVDLEQGQKWIDTVSAFLTGAVGKAYKVDVSKAFYVDAGQVRYLWRIVIQGDTAAALTLLGACALQAAMANAPEVESIPLVGRGRYEYDPARGKIKGGHELEQSATIVSMAIGAVPGGGGT